MKELFRNITQNEKRLIELLLDNDFQGSLSLKKQLHHRYFVRTIDDDGSIEFKIDKNKCEKSRIKERVPIEGVIETSTYPLFFLLHIVEGYIDELEAYKADFSEKDVINKLSDADFKKIKFN